MDIALIVTVGFNEANLRLQVMPYLLQHTTTTGENLLHHSHTAVHCPRMATKPFLFQLLVQLIMLLSSSRQNTDRHRSAQSQATMQYTLSDMD